MLDASSLHHRNGLWVRVKVTKPALYLIWCRACLG
jgi:hypothetical protein